MELFDILSLEITQFDFLLLMDESLVRNTILKSSASKLTFKIKYKKVKDTYSFKNKIDQRKKEKS